MSTLGIDSNLPLSLLPFQVTDKAGAVRADTAVAATAAAARADTDTVTIMVAIGDGAVTTVMITPTTVNSTTIHRNNTTIRDFLLFSIFKRKKNLSFFTFVVFTFRKTLLQTICLLFLKNIFF